MFIDPEDPDSYAGNDFQAVHKNYAILGGVFSLILATVFLYSVFRIIKAKQRCGISPDITSISASVTNHHGIRRGGSVCRLTQDRRRLDRDRRECSGFRQEPVESEWESRENRLILAEIRRVLHEDGEALQGGRHECGSGLPEYREGLPEDRNILPQATPPPSYREAMAIPELSPPGRDNTRPPPPYSEYRPTAPEYLDSETFSQPTASQSSGNSEPSHLPLSAAQDD